MDVRQTVKRYRWPLAALAVALAAIVLLVFEPQTLFIDEVVEDEFPGDAAGAPLDDETVPADEMQPDETMSEDMPEPAAAPAEPILLADGEFSDRSHPTAGRAGAYELADGNRVLRLEDLVTDNGPDLVLYLSSAAPDAPAGEFDDDFVSLGDLKGNLGDQNYDLPSDVDLDRYSTVVVWCRRFAVAFGVAELAPTG